MDHKQAYESAGMALRLILTYRQSLLSGQEVTLEEIERVDMLVEASDELPEAGSENCISGFWYELQTPGGEILYRNITANPIRIWIDLPNEEDPTRILRYEMLPEENIFTLLIPYYPEANVVILHSSPLNQFDNSEPAEPLWRIELPILEDKKEGVS